MTGWVSCLVGQEPKKIFPDTLFCVFFFLISLLRSQSSLQSPLDRTWLQLLRITKRKEKGFVLVTEASIPSSWRGESFPVMFQTICWQFQESCTKWPHLYQQQQALQHIPIQHVACMEPQQVTHIHKIYIVLYSYTVVWPFIKLLVVTLRKILNVIAKTLNHFRKTAPHCRLWLTHLSWQRGMIHMDSPSPGRVNSSKTP